MDELKQYSGNRRDWILKSLTHQTLIVTNPFLTVYNQNLVPKLNPNFI